MLEFWEHCQKQLQKELTPQQYKAWIVQLSFDSFDQANGILTLGASSRIKADNTARMFGTKITLLAQKYWDSPITLKIIVQKTKPKQTAPQIDQPPPHKKDTVHKNQTEHPETNTESPPIKTKESLYKNTHLDKKLVLETLVTGSANKMAQMVGLEVIKQLGERYNPFYIYGGVGVGKTHLMHAIGNEVLRQDPNKKVRYLFANSYVSDVVKAYQKNQFEEFKNYYQGLDLLLIDDIQFFGEGDKQGTQEAFFELFEHLTRHNKQIIMTSDRYPRDLVGIKDRLRSRFMSGIDVQIEPPEFEMRVGILLKKAELEHIVLPEEIAHFMAQLIKGSARELEGALKKVIAHCRLSSCEINLEHAKLALKALLSKNQDHISVEMIQKTVADFYKIKVADMYSNKKPKNIVVPRQIAMYLTKELTQKSLPEIGEHFGGRDHTTVLHACRKISECKQTDTILQNQLHVLEQILRS